MTEYTDADEAQEAADDFENAADVVADWRDTLEGVLSEMRSGDRLGYDAEEAASYDIQGLSEYLEEVVDNLSEVIDDFDNLRCEANDAVDFLEDLESGDLDDEVDELLDEDIE